MRRYTNPRLPFTVYLYLYYHNPLTTCYNSSFLNTVCITRALYYTANGTEAMALMVISIALHSNR